MKYDKIEWPDDELSDMFETFLEVVCLKENINEGRGRYDLETDFGGGQYVSDAEISCFRMFLKNFGMRYRVTIGSTQDP